MKLSQYLIYTSFKQKIYTGTMNFNETNFRIQTRSIDVLLGGQTKCNGNTVHHEQSIFGLSFNL